jgi:hypothetical protein
MADATAPCTLSEAIALCNGKRNRDVASPIDILAVVVDLSKSKDPFPFVCLWIQDASLSSDTKALFSLKGYKALDRIQDLSITIGDVLRFNRVSLKEVESAAAGGSDATSYHFYHSWVDPEPGPDWCRLCHVGSDPNDSIETEIESVHDTMQTDPACLESLVAWYQQSDYFATRGGPALTPLLCQQRSLIHLHSLVGVTSNVVVKVIEFQRAVPPVTLARKRSSGSMLAPCSFALLSDVVGSMAFLDDENRFHSILEQAFQTCRPLRLTRVSAQSGRSLPRMRKDALDEVILVPTKLTQATLLDEHDTAAVSWGREDSQVGSTQSQIPITLIDQHANKKQRMVVSPLRDMLLWGSKYSLSQVSGDEARIQWIAALVQSSDGSLSSSSRASYGNVILTLLETAVLPGNPRVHATGSVVQKLCCDLTPDELTGDNNSYYGLYAFNILFSMWKDQVPLCWTLEPPVDGTSSYRVVHVSLPKLTVPSTYTE